MPPATPSAVYTSSVRVRAEQQSNSTFLQTFTLVQIVLFPVVVMPRLLLGLLSPFLIVSEVVDSVVCGRRQRWRVGPVLKVVNVDLGVNVHTQKQVSTSPAKSSRIPRHVAPLSLSPPRSSSAAADVSPPILGFEHRLPASLALHMDRNKRHQISSSRNSESTASTYSAGNAQDSFAKELEKRMIGFQRRTGSGSEFLSLPMHRRRMESEEARVRRRVEDKSWLDGPA
ncbi:hypothetical protein BCR33DRAFT_720496 [Rhizoclosmatium globosum]|uniref:Uncharacterized protein n=1 Tax=Rhizoclosmatium globosum TaxID=329046 RepID=A0A1Y2BVQ0_9FUNG|nr:hypothetical protein BCR33DRAFT_720496 [Rhizoclosmatium globosum]|eukprot:ORY38826.1 hypothetical protein BCR33DRAFT_720496 [Rhizoclosmatium globosum]